MISIISVLFLINAMLCLLLALHLFSGAAQRLGHTSRLGMCYAFAAMQQVSLSMDLIWEDINLVPIRAVSATLLGPIFLYYYGGVMRFSCRWYWMLLQLVPAAILSLILWGNIPVSGIWVDVVILISFWGYALTTVALLLMCSDRLGYLSSWSKVATHWLWALACILLINALAETGISIELNSKADRDSSLALLLSSSIYILINSVTLFLALQRHPFWEWMLEQVHSGKQAQITAEELSESRIIFARFVEQLDTQQWFREQDAFPISKAAKVLNLGQRQLSEAINRIAGGSYSQYMNQKRVDYAKALLESEPGMPITTLMYESGFRTKSSFNREFVRLVGESPSAYRQRIE